MLEGQRTQLGRMGPGKEGQLSEKAEQEKAWTREGHLRPRGRSVERLLPSLTWYNLKTGKGSKYPECPPPHTHPHFQAPVTQQIGAEMLYTVTMTCGVSGLLKHFQVSITHTGLQLGRPKPENLKHRGTPRHRDDPRPSSVSPTSVV